MDFHETWRIGGLWKNGSLNLERFRLRLHLGLVHCSGEMRCVRCSEKDLMEWPSFLWIICINFLIKHRGAVIGVKF